MSKHDDEQTIVMARRVSSAKGATLEKVSLNTLMDQAKARRVHATNPLLECGTEILTLLGLLRSGRLDTNDENLRDQLDAALIRFRSNTPRYRISTEEAADSGYALAATCDDLIQNLPGADVAFWQGYGFTSRFFDDPNPGIGFFTRLHRLSQDPVRHAKTLEIMLACLALGFEGQYRNAPDGPPALLALRSDVYQRMRTALPRPRPTLSRNWLPVIPRRARRQARMPIWAITGLAAAMAVVMYGVLAWTMTRDAQAAQQAILDLHDPTLALDIDRTPLPDAAIETKIETYHPPPTEQIDRLKTELQSEIQAARISIAEEGDFIAIRLGSALEFPGGGAVLLRESPIILRIAEFLNAEPGAILIEGHSDNIPLSGRGRFKTNEELSEARAAAVRDVLTKYIADPDRMRVVGVGAAKPLDRANTAQARARNRRVDILLPKKERL